MGQPKELLTFRGLTCLEVVLGACDASGLDRPIVVTRAERRPHVQTLLSLVADDRGGALRSRNDGDVCDLVVNPHPDLGQTSSLRAGLERLPASASGFLIYPVDHPLVTADDVAELCALFVASSPDVAIVAPSFRRRRGHPLVVRAALAQQLLALPAGASARDVLSPDRVSTRFMDVEDDRILCDMDTPDAYANCLRRYEELADASADVNAPARGTS